MAALAQIDTGCQVGVKSIVESFGAYVVNPNSAPPTLPYGCVRVLTINVLNQALCLILYHLTKTIDIASFSLPVRIAEDSKVDLILGLETIKKLNLVKIIPEFFQNPENIENRKITHIAPSQRLNQSTNMVLIHVDVPLLLRAESNTVENKTLHETLPPVISSLEGIKPSDANSRWQDNMVARGACTSKKCTISCVCPTSLASAVARLDSDEFTVHPTVEAAILLPPPRQNYLGVTTERSPELATPTPSSKAPAQTRGLVAALLRERKECCEKWTQRCDVCSIRLVTSSLLHSPMRLYSLCLDSEEKFHCRLRVWVN